MSDLKKKPYQRKNEHAAEEHKARKQAANAARGKQVTETFNLIPGRHAFADAKYRHIQLSEVS